LKMDERELRKQRRALREAEIRMKLEREIRASTDFIFGVNQPERQAAGARAAGGGERVGGFRDRRMEILAPNIREPAPLNNPPIQQNIDANQMIADNSELYVACPICLFPMIMSTMESHITACIQEDVTEIAAADIPDVGSIEIVDAVRADGGTDGRESTKGRAQTNNAPQCAVCWEPEQPGDLRCPAGAHVICDGCLVGLVRTLAEQSPAQLGREIESRSTPVTDTFYKHQPKPLLTLIF
jgi:hypothetical protein